MSASIGEESLTMLENAEILKELVEKNGVESEGGKNLDLCREVDIFATVFWDVRWLTITRVRVFGSVLFLTDIDSTFLIYITEDEDNPGEPVLIYENLQVRGPGCSEVGDCEDLDSSDLQDVIDAVKDTIKQTQA